MRPAFSIQEALWFGWEKTRAHSSVVFQVVLTLLALEVARAIVEKVLEGTALGFLASVVLFGASVVLGLGGARIALRLAGNHPTRYADIIPPLSLLWRYIGAWALMGLIALFSAFVLLAGVFLVAASMLLQFEFGVWGGAALALVGAAALVYFLLRFFFVKFSVLDGHSSVESLRHSGKITRNTKGRLFLFLLAAIGFNVLGALCFLVGLLLTIPVTIIASAHIYLKLKNRS